ncbi:PREDICTED: cysteine-rich and transmembrane domain-containing protein A-like [Ipomoea nil]|uniref:cysteine-rich and transmembrane domain-containing protein A-like n=1 Tax=Ipomoea nil TaxID=35883 RepID=UPI00090108A2|nr:PREDICTED: cysteine-rich and transmembrane domain-containing protein A-like [Ipomoea nil]
MSNCNQATCPLPRPEMSPPMIPPLLQPPPPPPGYPVSDGGRVSGDVSTPGRTRSRGDGFWRGCCAALCCCCLLDACV